MAVFFERNLDLIASQYQIDKAEAQEWIAGAIPNPFFSIGMNELTGALNFRPNLGAQGMGINLIVTQLLETNGKRDLRKESSRIGREAVEADFKDSVRVLANEVRRKFYDLLLTQKNLGLVQSNADRYERIVKANQIRHKAGDIAESDLVRVEIEGLKAKSDVDRAGAALKAARSELAKLLNWPEKSTTLGVKEEWPMVRLDTEKASEETMVATALDLRPDLKAQSLRASRREKDLELARRLRVPDVTVSVGYVNDSGNVSKDTGLFNIGVPLPLFYQYQGEIGRASAELNEARLQRELARNTIRNEVLIAFAALRSSQAVVARFESEVNQKIEKVREGAEFAYGQGSIGLMDLLDVERNYRAMMLEYYAALNDRAIAYADLKKAMGEEFAH